MTREELKKFIDTTFNDEILQKFQTKNNSYGAVDDGFHNFRSAANRIFGKADLSDMLRVLMLYMDKHLIALAQNLDGDKEFEERFRDIIVYGFIALAMYQEVPETTTWDDVPCIAKDFKDLRLPTDKYECKDGVCSVKPDYRMDSNE